MKLTDDTYLSLKRSVFVIKLRDDNIILYREGENSVRLRSGSNTLIRLIRKLQIGITYSDFLLTARRNAIDEKITNKILVELFATGLLHSTVGMSCLTNREKERFDRLLGHFGERECNNRSRFHYLKRLRDAHVLLIGIGGIGSWVALHLVASGVGRLTAVDGDFVEECNLGHQALYSESDIGSKKVRAAGNALNRLSQFTVFTGIDEMVESAQHLDAVIRECGKPDMIVLTADRPFWKILKWVVISAIREGIPLLHGRMQVGPLFIPGKTACPMCEWTRLADTVHNFDEIVEDNQEQNVNASAISTEVAVNGAIAAQEVINHLSGVDEAISVNNRITVRLGGTIEVRQTEFPLSNRCLVCSSLGEAQ